MHDRSKTSKDHIQTVLAGLGRVVAERSRKEFDVVRLVRGNLQEATMYPWLESSIDEVFLLELFEAPRVECVLEMLERQREVEQLNVWEGSQ